MTSLNPETTIIIFRVQKTRVTSLLAETTTYLSTRHFHRKGGKKRKLAKMTTTFWTVVLDLNRGISFIFKPLEWRAKISLEWGSFTLLQVVATAAAIKYSPPPTKNEKYPFLSLSLSLSLSLEGDSISGCSDLRLTQQPQRESCPSFSPHIIIITSR